MATHATHNTRLSRGGFTLIELAVVILIIGVLAALIIPAAMSARRAARISAVQMELSQLTTAVSQFRNAYGTEPPSSIVVYTTPAGWASDPTSMAKMRRIWPNFNFQQVNGFDSNGNANAAAIWYPTTWVAANVLTGAECLVFFLGGVNLTGVQPQGFSKNPASPFVPPGSDNRDGPYYDFKTSRFMDIDSDGFMEYKDSIPGQQLPIVYASSYEGQGYAAVDLIVTGTAADLSIPYQAAAPLANRPFLMPKSFQLISPGMDGLYGTGGAWSDSFAATIAADVQPVGLYATQAASQQARINELDNIANFSTGTLGGR